MICRKLLALLFLSSVFLTSCVKDEFNTDKISTNSQYNPNVVAPLINSELTLYDIIKDYDSTHLFVEDSSQFLWLVYNGNVFSRRADEFITINDQNISYSDNFTIPGGTPIGDSVIYTYSTTYTFSTPAGERYDSIFFKTGILDMALNTNMNHNAKVRVSIPNLTQSGVPFSTILYYNYIAPMPTYQIGLAGRKMSFDATNQITINYTVTAYASGNPNNSPYNIGFTNNFTGVSYTKLFGYFGQQVFNFNSDTISIEIFKNNALGTLYFEDPRLNIFVSNSFGMPINVSFNTIVANSPVNAPYTVPIVGPGLPNPLPINSPTITQIGQAVVTSVFLNQGNSTVKDAINISPRTVLYNITGLSNPGGVANNFVVDTSRFAVDVQVEIPLYGKAWDFNLQDTFKFEFEQVHEIEWVSFRLYLENWFPIEAECQLYFADSNNVKLDSLLLNPADKVLPAAIPGPAPAYRVTEPVDKYTIAFMEKARIVNLENCRKLFVRGTLNTTKINNAYSLVKIYSNYKLKVRVSTQVQFNVNPDHY